MTITELTEKQLNITLPSNMIISGNIFVAAGSYGGAGISPSLPIPPEAFQGAYSVSFVNPHPWLDNIRDYARMLEGEIKLPHPLKFSGNSRQRKKLRRMEERGYTFGAETRCQVCLEAAKKRRVYRRELGVNPQVNSRQRSSQRANQFLLKEII